MSCIGSQEGSCKNCFSTSVSRLRLVGGSPWGSCRGKDKIRYNWKTNDESQDMFDPHLTVNSHLSKDAVVNGE